MGRYGRPGAIEAFCGMWEKGAVEADMVYMNPGSLQVEVLKRDTFAFAHAIHCRSNQGLI